MKLLDLHEAKEAFGLAVSHEKNTNKFEDINLVNWATDDILDNVRSHGNDLFKHLVSVTKENETWNSLEDIIHRNARSSKNLGSDFNDDTFHITTKYGPFTAEEIGKLADQM